MCARLNSNESQNRNKMQNNWTKKEKKIVRFEEEYTWSSSSSGGLTIERDQITRSARGRMLIAGFDEKGRNLR